MAPLIRTDCAYVMAFGKGALALLLGRRKEIWISGKLKISWGSNFFMEGRGEVSRRRKGRLLAQTKPTLKPKCGEKMGSGSSKRSAGCLHPTHARSNCAWMGHPIFGWRGQSGPGRASGGRCPRSGFAGCSGGSAPGRAAWQPSPSPCARPAARRPWRSRRG
jgi:hypothetical protein